MISTDIWKRSTYYGHDKHGDVNPQRIVKVRFVDKSFQILSRYFYTRSDFESYVLGSGPH